MASRRHFLRTCAASAAGLAWVAGAHAEDKPAAAKPDPLLTPEAEKAVAAGRKYLKDAQHKDGSFGVTVYKGSVAVTSLCGLALWSGADRGAAGDGDPAVNSALDFVLGQEDAKQPGFLHNPNATPHGPMYEHGFGVEFLAAALGDVPDKKRAEKVRDLLGRAVQLTLTSQNAEKGWRYLPESKDSDLSVTVVQVCALRAARDAGVGVPKAALDDAAGYVKKCQDQSGGFRYTPQAGTVGWPRTAAGLMALYCAGVTRGKEVEGALAYLLKHRPDPKSEPRLHYFYGHSYAARATWAAGGDARKDWYTAARDELVAGQGADGAWTDPIDPHYATAQALIALQAPNGRLSPEF
jgi:hypothetical protein